MGKKLITACLGVLALAAFALPAIASASNTPEVTHPTGTRLATGTKILATSVGEPATLRTDPANQENNSSEITSCSKVTMTGELTKNDGKNVEGNITTATFEGTGAAYKGMNECTGLGGMTPTTNGGGVDGETVTNGTPWCLRSTEAMVTDEFQIRGGLCSEASRAINFVLHTTLGPETCTYTRANPIIGTYTTDDTGDAILSVYSKPKTYSDTTFTKSGGGVLCPSTGTLNMSLTLETDTTASADPLYIS